jgi:enamine deaminase RidA (YjgF/YER057c/UK114 family)
MAVERRSPGGRTAAPGYAEIAVTSGRLAFLAGQCPLDGDGELAGPGDVVAQTRQVVTNLRACLDDLGVGPQAVAASTVYVVGDQDALATAWTVFRESGVTGTPVAPSTLLGVERLGYTGQLVEVDAVVALD